MYEEQFKDRLSQLRTKRGVSARDMSLSLGQNQCYINNIENGKALPSMSAFFYICDYLGVTPAEFFDLDNSNPSKLSPIFAKMKKLSDAELEGIDTIITSLTSK